MDKVWNVSINGKTDCVIMNDAEAMMVKMKFMPDITMYDMTELHDMKPEHLHKINRSEALGSDVRLMWMKHALETNVLGGKPGTYVKECWDYKTLINM
jgi:hypothetical protein|tara:strand:+ start:26 stop:319 length:294 start_codon:yes stop_codon:yes gene_type:complete